MASDQPPLVLVVDDEEPIRQMVVNAREQWEGGQIHVVMRMPAADSTRRRRNAW